MKKRRILFFTAGPVATVEEAAMISVLDAFQRNSQQVMPGDCPEQCDAVAGLVPKAYANRPRIDRELTAEEMDALRADERALEAARAADAAKAEDATKAAASAPPDKPENTPEGAAASAIAAQGWGNPSV